MSSEAQMAPAASIYQRFQFTHAEIRKIRKWHRLRYGTTINDRRTLAATFLAEALKNQWLLLDLETSALDGTSIIPPADI